jgi:hypothetical protein
MPHEKIVVKCGECGLELAEEYNLNKTLPCPDCGSTKRNLFISIENRSKSSVSISAKSKDPSGFVKQEERARDSVSEKTGRPVKTTISIDRRDPSQTKKHHKIEELDEHGIIYKTIHDHIDNFPARRRPKKEE